MTREHQTSPRGTARVLAIASHPIQYQAPWFRALAQASAIEFSVLYLELPDAARQGRGFGVPFEWDVPLLEGYQWRGASGLNRRTGQGFFSTRLARPRALLRECDPDVVLLTGWHAWPLVQMFRVALRERVPILMRGDSNALRHRPWPVETAQRLLLRRCAALLCVGRANRALYVRHGIPDTRLFECPHFVDNARFYRAAGEAAPLHSQLRSRWSIPQDAVCFCYAGKLEPKKHILDLLAALREAVRRSPVPLHLLVVGTGELMPRAQALAAADRLPVTFAGFLNQSEMAQAYVASDCLVLPSDHGETWGLVVNEAMACGKPAIVSDRVGCAPDLVSEGVTGATFPFGDVSALAALLVDFASTPDRTRAMGGRARSRVLQDYSIERAVAGTLRAVDHVLGRP